MRIGVQHPRLLRTARGIHWFARRSPTAIEFHHRRKRCPNFGYALERGQMGCALVRGGWHRGIVAPLRRWCLSIDYITLRVACRCRVGGLRVRWTHGSFSCLRCPNRLRLSCSWRGVAHPYAKTSSPQGENAGGAHVGRHLRGRISKHALSRPSLSQCRSTAVLLVIE